ncbi:undecaprenyl pyrophosphate synthase, partial [Gracilibacillus halophilus YIM-C55.5]
KKEKTEPESVSLGTPPEHVAIIMDGNGRWAKNRGLPRIAGHREGMDNVKRIVKTADYHGVQILTLYAFSTENWKRPTDEIEFLMKLPIDFLQDYLPELIAQNVRVQTIGEVETLPKHTKSAVLKAVDQTIDNTGMILNLAINYGSRYEIAQSVKQICQMVQSEQLSIDDIDAELIDQHLYTANMKDPDLLIRTSGELRLSNFLLWQAAYSELWFTETLWPDFDGAQFEEALTEYQQRKRRFGGI